MRVIHVSAAADNSLILSWAGMAAALHVVEVSAIRAGDPDVSEEAGTWVEDAGVLVLFVLIRASTCF
jgi:hypothetical protein